MGKSSAGQPDEKARACDGLHTYMPWVRLAAASYGNETEWQQFNTVRNTHRLFCVGSSRILRCVLHFGLVCVVHLKFVCGRLANGCSERVQRSGALEKRHCTMLAKD